MSISQTDNIENVIEALSRSKFRSSFRLKEKEIQYLIQKGLPTILKHARDFIEDRLAPANPVNDGKQTPMKNHPVFIAQHATATCCRGCLAKWHKIARHKKLSENQIEYVLEVIKKWLQNQKI